MKSRPEPARRGPRSPAPSIPRIPAVNVARGPSDDGDSRLLAPYGIKDVRCGSFRRDWTMADPLYELAREVESSLDPLGPPRRDAGGALHWAAFNLRAARVGQTIVGELASGTQGYARLQTVLHEEWDVLEIAAMSLGFEDVMTAIDLCAYAVYLASGGTPSADGSFKDLGYWSATRAAALSAATRKWVTDLLSNPDSDLLRQCRDALTHRSVRRHIRIAVGSIEGRSLVEITQRPTVLDPSPSSLGSIGDLIPRLLAFVERQFRLCCDAIKADYGSGSSSKP
jgi:hypothetical protein